MDSSVRESQTPEHLTAWDVTGRREVLRVTLRTLTIAALLIGAAAAAVGPARDALTGFGAAAYLGVLWAASRRWSLDRLTVATVLGLSLIATYAMVVGDGIHDIAITVLPATVLSAGLLLEVRRAAALAALAIVAPTCVGWAEWAGLLETRLSHHTRLDEIAVLAVLLLAGAAVASLVIRTLNRALALAEANERNYREVWNATNEAILVHDPVDGRVLDMNDTAMTMFGFPRGMTVAQLRSTLEGNAPPYTAEDALARIHRAVEEGPQVFEWLGRRLDGSELWVEVALRSARIGGAQRVLAVVRDIDNRKKVQERLQQAEKLEAVGQLAGGIAHDFNNQLSGILGYAELLSGSGAVAPAGREALEGILVAARRASDVTRQLLAFARKGKVREVTVDLPAMVREVKRLLAHSVDRRIQIEEKVATTSGRTRGDPSQLGNALLNLALNARDAMPEGGRLTFAVDVVDLSAAECRRPPFELTPGKYVRLRVSDTGAGIDPAVRGRIFEPFFTTKETGTGMGLAAVYGTVTAHHGAIEVDSTAGQGTTFTILLPHTDMPVEVVAPPAPPRATPNRGEVLVVDDEPTLAAITRRILERAGYRVAAYTSTTEALSVFRVAPERFDAVVVDMMMPEMTGEQLLAQLRALRPDLPAIIMSGYIPDSEPGRAAAAAERFVAKPFTPQDLLSAVVAVIDAGRREEASGGASGS